MYKEVTYIPYFEGTLSFYGIKVSHMIKTSTIRDVDVNSIGLVRLAVFTFIPAQAEFGPLNDTFVLVALQTVSSVLAP